MRPGRKIGPFEMARSKAHAALDGVLLIIGITSFLFYSRGIRHVGPKDWKQVYVLTSLS